MVCQIIFERPVTFRTARTWILQKETTMTVDPPHSQAPRLAPLATTPSFLYWLLTIAYRLLLGKVITPARVLFTRMPRLIFPTIGMYRVLQSGLSLERGLVDLIQLRVSEKNGCTFCLDVHSAEALKHGLTRERLRACAAPYESPLFSDAEKAALRYADEIRGSHAASDAVFDALQRSFNEREIVEITWLVAFTGYQNTMSKALSIGSDGFCSLT
jgi:AhpD family alkylhydroperoxidase